RAYEGMATDVAASTVILFTGPSGRHGAATWRWGPHGWVPVATGRRPGVLSFAALAPAPDGDGVLLFGGEGPRGPSAALWALRGGGWQPLSVSRPAGRQRPGDV
ncbi:MAG TPA: hypothetical protein VMW49_08795, partial [Candidatus Dormibacteraeota bacterium]|nr:hypothetical protein [Candidatus Dormibacteraeota bacterium]